MAGTLLKCTESIPQHLRAVGSRILVTHVPSNPQTEKNGKISHEYKAFIISELPVGFE